MAACDGAGIFSQALLIGIESFVELCKVRDLGVLRHDRHAVRTIFAQEIQTLGSAAHEGANQIRIGVDIRAARANGMLHEWDSQRGYV